MTKRYYPEKFNVTTPIDDGGALIDLPRITGEDPFKYKKRILESSRRASNSSYKGLINGINRELGLERNKILEISLRSQARGSFSSQEVSCTGKVVRDERQYGGTIDGDSVVAVNSELLVNSHVWEEDELVGLSLTVRGESYPILSNTTKLVQVSGASFSDLVGQDYLIKANWTENQMMGMACHIGNKKFSIMENTSNTITLNDTPDQKALEDYEVTSNRPRVEITSSRIILYKEYLSESNYQMDHEVSLREKNTQHTDVILSINESSRFFRATNLVPDNQTYPAFTIRKQDSNVKRFGVEVPSARYFKLKDGDIQNGTMQFSETTVFMREVEDFEEAPVGPYYSMDYKQGIVRSKNVPTGRGTVSYVKMDIPFEVEATPAVITAFADNDAENFLFAQKEKLIYSGSRDRFTSSQPKGKMIEYISELLSVSNQSWGK